MAQASNTRLVGRNYLGRLRLTIGIAIPGSRFPSPGISDALIPGFRDYEKSKKMPEFYDIFARKKPFPEFWGQFPALKLRVSGFEPTPIRDHGEHRSMGAVVLNKLFMRRHLILLHSISLDA